MSFPPELKIATKFAESQNEKFGWDVVGWLRGVQSKSLLSLLAVIVCDSKSSDRVAFNMNVDFSRVLYIYSSAV